MSAIAGFTPTVTTPPTTGTGLQNISGSDFLKVMLAQLQQQDPLNPSNSDQLLTQMSQIKSLESNQALSDNLTSMGVQQSIAAGGNLIGKSVTGLDDTGNSINGTVTSIKVQNKKVRLQLDSGTDMALENVTAIAPGAAPAAATAASATANPLASLLAAAGNASNAAAATVAGH